jgi:hypothetical protein
LTLKAASACKFIGKGPGIPELGGMETFIGSLDPGNIIEELAALAITEDRSLPSYVKAERLYGAALRKFKRFLITNNGGNFCGLGCVEYRGYSCWTREENRQKIEEEGLKEIDDDIKNSPYQQVELIIMSCVYLYTVYVCVCAHLYVCMYVFIGFHKN